MEVVIYLLGMAWIAAGAIAILYTDAYRAYFNQLMTALNPIWLALIPALVGLLLIMAAGSTAHADIILFIGVLGIVKGIVIYFNPGNIVRTSQVWLAHLSDQGYRLVGIFALVLGTVVLSWIQ